MPGKDGSKICHLFKGNWYNYVASLKKHNLLLVRRPELKSHVHMNALRETPTKVKYTRLKQMTTLVADDVRAD